jgi:hypothetical protein
MADKKISALTGASTPLDGTEVLPIVQGGATVKVANNDLRPKQIQSNATSGVLQVAGPGAAATRVMTTPDANFTAARTDAGQTFTGNQQVNGTLGVKSTGGIVNVETTTARGSGSNYVTFRDPTGEKGYVGYISGANDGMYLFNVVNAPVLVGVNSSTTWTFTTAGNLAVANSGNGIDFSINTAAPGVTSELLDDYETGTWTPTYTPASGAFGAITYNSNTFGRYTKVGNAVFIVGLIITDAFAVGTGTGQGRISGLPFTPSPSASASINYSTNFNLDTPTGSFTSGTDIFLTSRLTSNGSSAAFNSANFTTGASAFANYVYFQMNYVV